MNHLHRLQQRLRNFRQAIFPNPNPYIPNGRDNLERDFQQQFYNSLEFAFLYQFPDLLIFLIHELLVFAPYSNEYLTVLDVICAILAHISLIIFVKTIFELKTVSREKAYLTHFANNFILILLQSIILTEIVYHCYSGKRLRAYKENFQALYFITSNTLVRIIMQFYENVRNYFRLKEHQQILDTIPQLPYKPKGA